jgi:hypothetical protein
VGGGKKKIEKNKKKDDNGLKVHKQNKMWGLEFPERGG